MNRIDELFAKKKHGILNIYCTAGFPKIDSLLQVIPALQQHGADIIEVGIPYSDPIADGPVIQQSNMQALHNGMSIKILFGQLNVLKGKLTVPVILMGYLNPVLQYGIEKFCEDAAATGISGIILPDVPLHEYELLYKKTFEKYKLHFIFLISPETNEERIKKADRSSKGFLYAVSSSATTGNNNSTQSQEAYFTKLKGRKFKNQVLIGFGIKDKHSFDNACKYAAGAIIGTAYINAIAASTDLNEATATFIKSIKSITS
ncbi:MAG: tryptophan synthase subunit alpha [Ferruginibacter sp.]